MKHATTKQLAAYVAVIAGLGLSGFLLLSLFIFPNTSPWLLVPPLVIGLSALLYLLVLFTLERFLYRKIKLVYKTIHQLKAKQPGSTLKERIRRGGDVIGDVHNEVLDWARTKSTEIEELQRMEQFRRDFIGNLSHELKTPIFNIQGYISTLVDGGLNQREIAEKYLLNAERNVERMISLVEDLDTIYKLESGRITMEHDKVDLLALVAEVMEMLELKALNKGIRLEFKDNSTNPIWVRADRDAIRQVYTNLMVNSIVYGKENGYTRMSFYDMDEVILCEVSDDGPGIEEKHLKRLFERFYRVDKSRSRHQGGTGLGLSIVKHILEAHGQSIHVRSLVGKGSTFSFTLPKWDGV